MDVSSLRERPDLSPMTVSELNEKIKQLIESTPSLSHVSVRGELSNFTNHVSGHLYFTLKDPTGQIKCVMFRSAASRLRFVPKDGMKVQLSGSVSVYGRSGQYQLYVDGMQPDGVGALYLAYEQLKEKLAAEGLFDPTHKRPIPSRPHRIGIVTSPTGAAVRDIIDVCGRRYPMAQLYLYPSLVQGDGAEGELIEALTFFENSRLCDTVIIGRGGGSIEDLWAFNSERLARVIYSMTVPVISAVGHETDFTICDFVSDLRAPTPSAAAELATPDARELYMYLDSIPERMKRSLSARLDRAAERLAALRVDMIRRSFDAYILGKEERVRRSQKDAAAAIGLRLGELSAALSYVSGKADALSPLAVLSRGYATVEKDGHYVRSTTELSIGERVSVRLRDGLVHALVTDTETGEKDGKTNL